MERFGLTSLTLSIYLNLVGGLKLDVKVKKSSPTTITLDIYRALRGEAVGCTINGANIVV